MKRLRMIFLILIGVACLFGIIYALFIRKELSIKTYSREERVLVHTEYNDPEIDLCYGTITKCNKLSLERTGEVDIHTLGDYVLKYKYITDGKENYLRRIVHVYDDVNPEINIEGDIIICPDKKVIESKYTAIDNYDGDLTDKVKIEIAEEDKYPVVDE